jgi:hypothetical protein
MRKWHDTEMAKRGKMPLGTFTAVVKCLHPDQRLKRTPAAAPDELPPSQTIMKLADALAACIATPTLRWAAKVERFISPTPPRAALFFAVLWRATLIGFSAAWLHARLVPPAPEPLEWAVICNT